MMPDTRPSATGGRPVKRHASGSPRPVSDPVDFSPWLCVTCGCEARADFSLPCGHVLLFQSDRDSFRLPYDSATDPVKIVADILRKAFDVCIEDGDGSFDVDGLARAIIAALAKKAASATPAKQPKDQEND